MTGPDNPYDPIRSQDVLIARLRALHPVLIDLTTGRVERLLEALGRPQDRLPPVIHVAGTNGKGSTTAYLRAIGEAAGMRVHVLTSPHLVRFVERIRVAGTLITEAELEALITRVEAANAGAPISFFEITTVIAILAFAETPADLCVIEVGLGGRFDATNIFAAPAVTVITPVDYDHLELLGPELSKIAWEKAGIMRPGRPCVVAHQLEEAFAVIEAEAEKVGAPMIALGRDADAWEEHGRLRVSLGERLLDLPAPGLFGPYQFDNAGLSVVAMAQLDDPRITEDAMAAGVAGVVWPARFQRLTAGPVAERAAERGVDVWLDGGHNPHAARALVTHLQGLRARDGRPVTVIMGLLANKDAAGVLEPFAGQDFRLIFTDFAATAAASSGDLAAVAAGLGLAAETAPDVTSAVRMATADGVSAHVLICGSLYLAGEALGLAKETWPT